MFLQGLVPLLGCFVCLLICLMMFESPFSLSVFQVLSNVLVLVRCTWDLLHDVGLFQSVANEKSVHYHRLIFLMGNHARGGGRPAAPSNSGEWEKAHHTKERKGKQHYPAAPSKEGSGETAEVARLRGDLPTVLEPLLSETVTVTNSSREQCDRLKR